MLTAIIVPQHRARRSIPPRMLPAQSVDAMPLAAVGNLDDLNYVRSRVVVIEDSGEGINRYIALCCRLKHPAHLTRRDKFFVLRLMRG